MGCLEGENGEENKNVAQVYAKHIILKVWYIEAECWEKEVEWWIVNNKGGMGWTEQQKLRNGSSTSTH